MIARSEFEDCGAGGAEGGQFLAGEDIIGFPLFREGEGGCYASVEVAFGVEPGDIEP